jgi:hypothetical protein
MAGRSASIKFDDFETAVEPLGKCWISPGIATVADPLYILYLGPGGPTGGLLRRIVGRH